MPSSPLFQVQKYPEYFNLAKNWQCYIDEYCLDGIKSNKKKKQETSSTKNTIILTSLKMPVNLSKLNIGLVHFEPIQYPRS